MPEDVEVSGQEYLTMKAELETMVKLLGSKMEKLESGSYLVLVEDTGPSRERLQDFFGKLRENGYLKEGTRFICLWGVKDVLKV